MAKYLIKTVETWRVASEDEAKVLIEDSKKSKDFTLSKYASEYKCAKAKGEVVDEWYRVTLTKDFTSEKEPDCTTTIEYNVELGAFPEPVRESSYNEGSNDDEDEEDMF